jgi:hypothetical protein
MPAYRAKVQEATGKPIAAAGAELTDRQWRAEIRLLATVAPIGRWGLELARRASITIRDFANDDTIAVFAGLSVAADRGLTEKAPAAFLCRIALRLVNLWDDKDERPFVSGRGCDPG